MPKVTCNSISLYYETYGEGQPLVLISGLGGDRTFWQSSLESLSSRFQVIVFDTRGSGKTEAPTSEYSMKLFADDLAALLDALNIQKANVLGFSMGGNIALTFALNYPERVEKLIIAASFAVMNQQARLFLDAVLSVYEGGASAKQMFQLIAPWLFSATFLSDPNHAAYLMYDEEDPEEQPLYAWKNQYLAQQAFNAVSRLHEIKIPTLIISGGMDRLAHPEDSILLANKIEHAVLRNIPESGHLINYEYPDEFHRCILEFL
ncbi:alpha/beta hydrolase [Paenibacillus herberti]|uniref:Alpha/beta hydrolase n=2 Tax=Paenibacillus herberti TaxID=1619309 RepID=A0A229P0A8_9BACL|nr:alpha/beta hydrolase [Paenibacillus herberti]